MRLVLHENSDELTTCEPHIGEFESLADAKRAADRRREFISTELAIATEAGDLISYRPGVGTWVDVIDLRLLS